MKTLQSYINEGLIGDIIMTVLRSGLGWIDKGFDLVADTIKSSVNSSWDIVKDRARKSENKEAAQKIIQRGEKGLTEDLKKNVLSKKTFLDRQRALKDYIIDEYGPMIGTKKKPFDENHPDFITLFAKHSYDNYLATMSSGKSTKKDKEDAQKAFQELMQSPKFSPVAKQYGFKEFSKDKKEEEK